MYCITLRFAENFAPKCGTIAEHQKIIDKIGYVYYGKLGSGISNKVISEFINQENPKMLLIHSGGVERYWAFVDKIQTVAPDLEEFPQYYHQSKDKIKSWIRVTRFEPAEKNIMSKCYVKSSGAVLSEASKRSMNPYSYVIYNEE